MEDQGRLQTILMNIAAKYINIGLAEVEETLNLTLGEMATFVEADRAYIFDYDWEAGTCSNTYEWCSEGTSPEIDHLQDIPLENIAQWADTHKSGKTMYIPDVSDLPEEDGVRQILEPQQVKSLIAIPIMDRDHCSGFIGFDSVKKHHVYSERERSLLLLFAEMIINVRNRQASDLELQAYSAALEAKNIQLDHALSVAEAARKVKSEFLANMSHEIKTPMNAIIGFTDLLEKTELNKEQQNYVLKINRAAENLLIIINRIFDFSKMQDKSLSVEKTDFNLDEVLKKAPRKKYPKISSPGETKPLLPQKVLKEKMAVLKELLEGYDTTSVDIIEQIRDSISKAGMETEILDMEKKTAAYDFDAALEILNKIMNPPD